MPQLTPQRRSQLLQQLMRQMEQDAQFRGNKSIGEVGLRLGTAFLNKKQADKLKEEEAGAAKTQGANEYSVLEALTQGQSLDRTAYKPEAAAQPGNATINPQAALAQLMTQNPGSAFGQGIAGQMAQNALTPPKPKEVKWDLEEVKSGDQYETYITRDGLPVEKFSTADRMQKLMSGTPEEWGTNSQQGSHIIDFGKKLGSIDSWGKTGTEFVGMLRENPGANTTVATMANVGNRLWNEVKALKQQGVYKFADDFRGTDIKKWEGVFSANGLAGANAKVKRGFLALAIQGAAAQGMGTGRALSDKDVEQQLRTLGANQSDPEIIAGVFSDSYQSMINGVQSEAQNFPYLQKKFDDGEWSINEYDFGASKPKVRTYVPGQGFVEQ